MGLEPRARRRLSSSCRRRRWRTFAKPFKGVEITLGIPDPGTAVPVPVTRPPRSRASWPGLTPSA
eukprot:11224427-Lingulodinium_polyedra.AAC.1